MISPNWVMANQQQLLERMSDEGNPTWELCQIQDVNADAYTVNAYFFRTKKLITDVPFVFPYINMDHGILLMPQPGSIALAAWVHPREPYIIAFVSVPSINASGRITARQEVPLFSPAALNPGEMMLIGSGRSFIKFNMLGDLVLSSPRFHSIEIEEEYGSIRLNCERYIERSELGTVYKGIGTYFQGNIEKPVKKSDTQFYTTSVERVYEFADNTISNFSTAEELVNAINQSNSVQNVATDTPEQNPLITIVKGNVIDDNGNLVKDPDTNQELCFQLKVDKNGDNKVAVTVDKSGHISVAVSGGIKLTITGDVSLNVIGNVTVQSSGTVQISGANDVQLQGKSWLHHTHTAPDGGGITSGVN